MATMQMNQMRRPYGTMTVGPNGGEDFMPQGVEARARRDAEAKFMGPMMPGGASPVGNLNVGTMALPQTGTGTPGTASLREGTAGMPSLPVMGAGGMMRNANGDLTMEARNALDARTGYRRKDPMAMTGIAGAHPARRNAMGDGTNNPNAFRSGRSMNDPDRIAEQMRRRGNPQFIMQRAAMREGQAFQREMFDMQQGAMDARRAQDFQMGMAQDQQRFDQGLTMFQMETQRRADESEADFNRRMEMERAQREAGRITGTTMLPLPPVTPGGQSPGALPMLQTADGGMKPMGGGPVMAPQAPQSGMMALPDGSSIMTINGQPVPEYGRFQQEALPGPTMPGQAAPARTTRVDGGARMEAPKIQTVPDPTDELGERKIPVIWNPETGVFERVQIVDRNGDGIDDRTQSGAGAAAGGAVSAPRTTAGGNRFTVTPRA